MTSFFGSYCEFSDAFLHMLYDVPADQALHSLIGAVAPNYTSITYLLTAYRTPWALDVRAVRAATAAFPDAPALWLQRPFL